MGTGSFEKVWRKTVIPDLSLEESLGSGVVGQGKLRHLGRAAEEHALAAQQSRRDKVTFCTFLWERAFRETEHQGLTTCLFVTDIFPRIVDSSPDLLSLPSPSFPELT